MNFIPFFIILSVSALAFPVFAEKSQSISQEVFASSQDLKPSEEAPISTWKEALESAYEKNPDLKISQSKLRQTQEGKKQVWGEWVPEVSGFLNQSASDSRTKNTQRDTLSESRSGGFEVRQSLFSGGGTVARLKQTSRNIQAESSNLLASESQILLDALSAFLNVYTAQESVEILKQNEENAIRILEQTRARSEVGEITYTDVLTQEAQVAAAKAQRVSAEGNLATARAHFESVIGKSAAEKLIWPKDIPLEIPKKLEEAIDVAFKNNPGLKAALLSEEAARFNINSVLGSTMLPNINASGSASRQQNRNKTTLNGDRVNSGDRPWMRELRAEVRMTVPIPTGVPQSKVRVAEQQKTQATFARQKAQLDVREAIVKAWSNHETSLKNMNQYQVEVKAAEQSFEGAKEEYALGLKSVIDLAIIQAKLLQAKLQLISARQSVIIAKAQIQSILGRLLTKILKIAVHEYNPDMTNTWFGIKE